MNNSRVYNFGAGPAMLPEPILLKVQQELLNWQGLGISILEIGHRSDEFKALLHQTETSLRELLHVPDEYHVLFLGGPARLQFPMIPMNFLKDGQQAAYFLSGYWSTMAYDEASRIAKAYSILPSNDKTWFDESELNHLMIKENTSYLYYCSNETINGVRLGKIPSLINLPLVADMTSCLLTEPLNINDFSLIFAGAQKNIAAAGMTIVIVRKEWLDKESSIALPSMFDYRKHALHHSLLATPPVFNCYLAGKMFDWIKSQGGVDALFHQNFTKANLLYKFIDDSSFYQCLIPASARSRVNICFSLLKKDLENEFITNAEKRGLYALRGHRKAGGLRASLYNSMPISGVEALIEFMDYFAKAHQT